MSEKIEVEQRIEIVIDGKKTVLTSNPTVNTCCAFFYVSGTEVGIRNNCDKCKEAVVFWTPIEKEKKYEVKAHSSVKTKILGNAQMTGEEDC